MAQSDSRRITHPGQEGLDVIVSCTKKNYIFEHGADRNIGVSGAATLGGLYNQIAVDQNTNDSLANDEKTTLSTKVVLASGTDLSPDQRNNLSYAIDQVKPYLAKKGITLMEGQLNLFHKEAARTKKKLRQQADSKGRISASIMRQAETHMSHYNICGYKLRITGQRVMKNNPLGSKQRADKLFVLTKCIRSYFIDRMLTEAELQEIANHLLNAMTSDEIKSVEVERSYLITRQKGRKGDSYVPISQVTYKNSAGQTKTIPRSYPGGMRP